MANFTLIKMYALSPLHIGTGREAYDTASTELHSDTLSAALAAVGVTTGILRGDEVEQFLSSFTLSSAFPFYQGHYFLPKLQGKIKLSVRGEDEHVYRKKLKRVKYIESSLWVKLAYGESLTVDEEQIIGAFLIPKDTSLGLICKSQVNQRVCVSRDGSEDSDPFFFEWHYYDQRAGLYCLTDAKGELLEKIQTLFSLLGETGIGTDKSIGGGNFKIDISTFTYCPPIDADTFSTLSLYIPSTEELKFLFDGTPLYSLVARGGYMAGSNVERFRHLRKKIIYAFGVGSMFQTEKPLIGRVVDLRPDWNDGDMHSVYRSGRVLTFKIKQSL